jgi:hypothetical protein
VTDPAGIPERLAEVRERIATAARAAGRDPATVTLVAVSKEVDVHAVVEAAAAGQRDFGENRAQELERKVAAHEALAAGGAPAWHFIGRLQRNKAKLVAGRVALVHAVDSAELAAELGKRAGAAPQRVLIAVNVAGEATKGGVAVADAPALARAVAATPGVELAGLMTMPPPDADPRPAFAALRDLRARLAGELGAALPVLSMGMSGDFEEAIAHGATHVRIGTAIFGDRGRE